MKPTKADVNDALDSIARTERPANHSRNLAPQAITSHRERLSAQLTQAQIDSGSETEERRRRFVQSSVKWSKRTLWSKLFRR